MNLCFMLQQACQIFTAKVSLANKRFSQQASARIVNFAPKAKKFLPDESRPQGNSSSFGDKLIKTSRNLHDSPECHSLVNRVTFL